MCSCSSMFWPASLPATGAQKGAENEETEIRVSLPQCFVAHGIAGWQLWHQHPVWTAESAVATPANFNPNLVGIGFGSFVYNEFAVHTQIASKLSYFISDQHVLRKINVFKFRGVAAIQIFVFKRNPARIGINYPVAVNLGINKAVAKIVGFYNAS